MVIFGRNLWLLFGAIGAVEWLTMARIVRGQVISIKEKKYIKASEVLGFSDNKIILNHILPMIVPTLIVMSSANFASAILIKSLPNSSKITLLLIFFVRLLKRSFKSSSW